MSETRSPMRWTFRQSAGVNTRFAPNAWDSQIGKVVPMSVEGDRVSDVRVVAAEVIEDGAAVLLTYELVAGVDRSASTGGGVTDGRP